MDAIGDYTQGHRRASKQGPNRTRRPVVQASHGVKAVGDHPHALLIGQARRPFISGAMAEAHHHAALA